MNQKANKKDKTLFKKVFNEVLEYHYSFDEDNPADPDECPGDWDADPMGFFEDLDSTFDVSPENWDFNASLKEIKDAVFEKWDGEITGPDEEGNWDADIAHGMA